MVDQNTTTIVSGLTNFLMIMIAWFNVNKQYDALSKRIDSLDKRIDDSNLMSNKRIEDLSRNIDQRSVEMKESFRSDMKSSNLELRLWIKDYFDPKFEVINKRLDKLEADRSLANAARE